MRKEEQETGEFEKALTCAMRRVEAPETLARFLAAAAESHAGEDVSWWQRKHRWALASSQWPAGWRLWVGSAAAAALVAGVFTGEQMRQRHERQRAQRVQQQFETAMSVTSEALEKTQQRLERAGVVLGN